MRIRGQARQFGIARGAVAQRGDQRCHLGHWQVHGANAGVQHQLALCRRQLPRGGRQQADALAQQCLAVLLAAQGQAGRVLAQVEVAALVLVACHVLEGFQQRGAGPLALQGLEGGQRLPGQGDGIQVLKRRGAGGVAAVHGFQVGHHIGHVQRVPVRVEQFMRQIVRIQRGQPIDLLDQARLLAKVPQPLLGQVLQPGDTGTGLVGRAAGQGLCGQVQQFLGGRHGTGAWLAHVGQVKHPTGQQPLLHQLPQGLALRGRNPGIDAVADHEVAGRQGGRGLCGRRKVQAFVAQVVHAQRLGPGTRLGNRAGVDVDTEKLALGVGGGRNQGVEATAATQLQVGVGAGQVGAFQAHRSQRGAQPGRHGLAVEVGRIGNVVNVGRIGAVSGVVHGGGPWRRTTRRWAAPRGGRFRRTRWPSGSRHDRAGCRCRHRRSCLACPCAGIACRAGC